MAGEESSVEGVSKQAFDELVASVGELRKAFEGMRDAEGAKEKNQARETVVEAKSDLEELAKSMGLSAKEIRQAAEAAAHSKRKEETRALLEEILSEGETSDDEGGGDEKPEDEPKPEKEEPVEDSAPTVEHWSERPVTQLFGLGKS